jgi:hypothetical protein
MAFNNKAQAPLVSSTGGTGSASVLRRTNNSYSTKTLAEPVPPLISGTGPGPLCAHKLGGG